MAENLYSMVQESVGRTFLSYEVSSAIEFEKINITEMKFINIINIIDIIINIHSKTIIPLLQLLIIEAKKVIYLLNCLILKGIIVFEVFI